MCMAGYKCLYYFIIIDLYVLVGYLFWGLVEGYQGMVVRKYVHYVVYKLPQFSYLFQYIHHAPRKSKRKRFLSYLLQNSAESNKIWCIMSRINLPRNVVHVCHLTWISTPVKLEFVFRENSRAVKHFTATADDEVCRHYFDMPVLKPSVVDKAINQWQLKLRLCVHATAQYAWGIVA